MPQLALQDLRLAESAGDHVGALEQRELLVGERVEVDIEMRSEEGDDLGELGTRPTRQRRPPSQGLSGVCGEFATERSGLANKGLVTSMV